MRDAYKADVIREAIDSMKMDDFNVTRLKNDNGKAINLDIEALELLLNYYTTEEN